MSPLDLIMHCYPILVFFLYFSRFAPVNYRISTRRNAKEYLATLVEIRNIGYWQIRHKSDTNRQNVLPIGK